MSFLHHITWHNLWGWWSYSHNNNDQNMAIKHFKKKFKFLNPLHDIVFGRWSYSPNNKSKYAPWSNLKKKLYSWIHLLTLKCHGMVSPLTILLDAFVYHCPNRLAGTLPNRKLLLHTIIIGNQIHLSDHRPNIAQQLSLHVKNWMKQSQNVLV
jgi:hypothetical protein